MKSFIVFAIISFFICLHGVAWGIYEFQESSGWRTEQTLFLMKTSLMSRISEALARKPKPVKKASAPQPVKAPDEVKPTEDEQLLEAEAVTPVTPAALATIKAVEPNSVTPAEPAPVELRRPVRNHRISVLRIKPEADAAVEEANEYYDSGVVHLQNTFNKDETFDRENDLAIEKFKKALAKYLEAEQIDPDNLWLRNRIKDTNSNLVTCRRQARRK